MDQQIEQLRDLLNSGQTEKANALIKSIISRPDSDKERGAALVLLANIYNEQKNQTDASYIAMLEQAISAIKQVNKAESKATDAFRVKEIKESLGK